MNPYSPSDEPAEAGRYPPTHEPEDSGKLDFVKTLAVLITAITVGLAIVDSWW